jgi:predicted flap endonuclease-1-like 5' DNA nuclease
MTTKIHKNGLKAPSAPASAPPEVMADLDQPATKPPASSDLTGIPYLGPSRVRALADAGITTLAKLRAASVEDIGSVKGVGMVNAARVKAWLNDASLTKPIKKTAVPVATKPAPGQKERPVTDEAEMESTPEVTVPESKAEMQTFVEDIEQIDQVISRFKEAIPDDKRKKKLSKELAKLSVTVTSAPESGTAHVVKNKAKANRSLEKIAKLLTDAVEKEKFSDKRQSLIGSELKDLRKKLEKSLG